MKIDYTYGPPTTSSFESLAKAFSTCKTSEERYGALVELMKLGRFEFRDRLFELTKCGGPLARKSLLLYSEVADNDHLITTLPAIETDFEGDVLSLTTAANSSLSLGFVPLLISEFEDFKDQGDDEEADDLYDSIQNLTGVPGSNATSLRSTYESLVLNTKGYVWNGKPVNLQLVFKQFMASATESMLNNSRFFFKSPDVKIMSLFTGRPLLVEGGSVIASSDLEYFQSYGETILVDRWEIGNKYFYGHKV